MSVPDSLGNNKIEGFQVHFPVFQLHINAYLAVLHFVHFFLQYRVEG